jgi:hypothetical protein
LKRLAASGLAARKHDALIDGRIEDAMAGVAEAIDPR